MAGTRKRKHAATSDDNTKQTPVQAGIKMFGAMTKTKSEDAGLKKRRKTVQDRAVTPPPQAPKPAPTAARKRKRGDEPDEEVASTSTCNVFQQFAKKEDPETPRTKRAKHAQPLTPVETPSKDAAALFDNLRLGAHAKAIPFSFGPVTLPDTPPRTPEADPTQSYDLPTELFDLIGLYAAFLSALSLYYSHNGTSSPADIKSLLPMVTKQWKKRAVTLDDLRRLLAVESEHPTFGIKDFGRAGICLTKSQPRGRATKRAASFVDEADLGAAFEDALMVRWSQWTGSAQDGANDALAFIEQLPLSDITKDDSVEKTAPMSARGHQRLAELKAGQAAAQREPTPTPTPETQTQPKSLQGLQTRGTNLLDRILAKQAHTASLPAGPTKDQLERKAALHRVEDVARVLDLLAAGRARCSFSMQATVQQLQQSLRNPISREEVERCLDVMAKEITPGFVALVKNGAVTGVVITRGGKVGLEELRGRVAAAMA